MTAEQQEEHWCWSGQISCLQSGGERKKKNEGERKKKEGERMR